MDLGENLLAAFGLIASSIIAIVANSLLLVVFCRRRGLRTISNRFVINLLFANVLSSILLLPTFILDSHLLHKTNPSSIYTQTQFQETNITANNDIIFASQTQNTEIIQNSSKDVTIVEESQEEIVIDSPQRQLEVIESTINYTLTYRSHFDRSDDVVCFLSEFVVTFVCTACIFSVLLIGVDQYFAVLYPLRYQSYINKTRSILLVLLAWFVSVLCGVGSAVTDSSVHYFRSCQVRCQYQSTTWTIIFSVLYLIVAILVPFLTICDIYVCIYRAAHKNSARVRKVTSMNFPISTPTPTLKKTHSAPNFSQYEVAALAAEAAAAAAAPAQQHLHDPLHLLKVQICRTSSDRLTGGCRKDLLGGSRNLLGQIRHKLSNASVFRYREESRTAKISLLVIFMVLLCYGPYGMSLVLSAVKISPIAIHHFNTASLILLITSNVISPFLFAYRNRRIQRELAKFLRIIPRNSIRGKRRNPPPNIVIQRNSEGNPLSSVISDNSDIKNKGTFLNDAANPADVTVPFLADNICCDNSHNVVNVETDLFETTPVQKKSILKRVCSSKSWNYKKCSFITVPDSCLDARGSFSSASTQVSTEES